ncbi:MAG TPA: hypothetical protein VHA09_04870 [Nitrososphaera sp.]|nr:hypothetical protein [Nitrososphaera sp.]
MNIKAVYAAGGGIAVVAVVIFFVLGTNNSLLPAVPQGSSTGGSSSTNNATTSGNGLNIIQPIINVKNVTVTKADDTHANVQVTFTVKNPNPTTVILETIHYTTSVDGERMTIGDVGQSAQGFLDSQSNLFPIVAGTTLTARDSQTVERTGAIASEWDKMVAGDAKFSIDGTYSYRITAANLQTTAADKDFTLTFP